MSDTEASPPTLYRVVLPVDDIDVATNFYARLFDVPGDRVSPGRHYFNLGGTILAVYDPAADGDPPSTWEFHPNQYIYVGVGDLEGAFERTSVLGGTLVSDRIESMPWGERLFYARDPSGSRFCLVDLTTMFFGSGE